MPTGPPFGTAKNRTDAIEGSKPMMEKAIPIGAMNEFPEEFGREIYEPKTSNAVNSLLNSCL